MLTAYARRLDKIYSNIGKSVMLPKVIKKMREEYFDDPHELYLQVCKKYEVTPEEKFDAHALVYGRTKFDKHKYEHTKNSDREKTEIKEKVVEIKEEVHEIEKEDSPTPEPESEDEEEPEPEKPARRFSFERRSDRAERRGYVSPRINSPRNHYRFKKKFVEDLDYVNVHPGDIVETMVLTASRNDPETGFWIPARILRIEEDKEVMDLQVLQPVKYGLAERAMNVPYRYVRCPANIVWKR